MKKINLLLAAFGIMSLLSNAQETQSVWVTLKDDQLFKSKNDGLSSNNEEINQLINQYNIKGAYRAVPASKKASLQNLFELECNCNSSELIEKMKLLPEHFEHPVMGPDYRSLYVPDDYSITYTNDYALNQINAIEAWNHTKGDTSVHIAISDMGFVYTHEELVGKIKYIDPYVYPQSYHHGTAVAITAAGNTDNATGKSSIGYDCSLELYPMNYNGILSASYNGVPVINISWMSGCAYSSYIQDIIDEAYANGSIIVCAAGNGAVSCNGPDSYVYPASLNHVISVTSIGPNYNHERYVGDPTTTHQHNDSVDIAAPGYDVALSLDPNSYITGNGSSFAAPLVSGTIGLMLSVNPCLSFEDIEQILKSTSVGIDSINPQYAGQIGAGALDADAAVEAALNYSTFSPQINANFTCDSWSYGLTVSSNHTIPITETLWMGSIQSSSINVETDQTIYVVLKDTNNCLGTDSITIDIPDPISILDSTHDALCFNETSGSIFNQINGGTPPYQYQWNDGVQTLNRNNIAAGTYELVVTDSNNCEFSQSYTIDHPSEIQTDIETTCAENDLNNGTATVVVTGGTPGYDFIWNDGTTIPNRSDLSAGIHGIEIIDQNGCSVYNEIEICSQTLAIDNWAESNLQIYPNPTTKQIFIDGTYKNLNIQIFDNSGQLVLNTTTTEQNFIDVSNLSKGFYILNIYEDHVLIKSEKVIKN